MFAGAPEVVSHSSTNQTRESQVNQQILFLDKAVENLVDATNSLEERLARVLTKRIDIPAEQAKNETPLVPLARELSGIFDRLIDISARLRDINTRIEL